MSPLAQLVRIHKALAHPARARIVMALGRGELCVCQINAVIGLAPSTMSAHLRELRDAALIVERKQGRWVHYRLAAQSPGEAAVAALTKALAADPQVLGDAALLEALTAMPVATVARPGFDAAALRRRCCLVPPRSQRTRREVVR